MRPKGIGIAALNKIKSWSRPVKESCSRHKIQVRHQLK